MSEFEGWDVFPEIEGGDDEFTKVSAAGHLALQVLADREDPFHEEKVDGPELRLLFPRRRLLVAGFGQSSWTAKGKQGLIPVRIEYLREFGLRSGLTVCVVFVEAGAHVCYIVWPGPGEPPYAPVALDKARPRQGWKSKHMWKYALDEAGLLGPHTDGKAPLGRLTLDVLATAQRSPLAMDKLFVT